MFEDRILGRQSDAAGANDDHNEQVEVAKIDNKVTKPPNTAQQNIIRVSFELHGCNSVSVPNKHTYLLI